MSLRKKKIPVPEKDEYECPDYFIWRYDLAYTVKNSDEKNYYGEYMYLSEYGRKPKDRTKCVEKVFEYNSFGVISIICQKKNR